MRTAIVSTYPPRACGIGTFAADLRRTLLGVAGIDARRRRRGRQRAVDARSGAALLATIAQAVRGDYVRAARMLGRLDVDVVLLQHEYGIFGGARRRVRALVRRGAGAAARRDAAHGALGADAASAATCSPSCAREAELVIVMTDTAQRCSSSAAPARRRRSASCRTARRARLTARAAGGVAVPTASPAPGDDGDRASCSPPSA